MNPQQGQINNRPESRRNQAPKRAPRSRNGHPAAPNPAPEDTALNPANPLRRIIQAEALRALRPGVAGAHTVSVQISHPLGVEIGGRAMRLGIPEAQLYQAAILLGFEWLCAQDLFHHPYAVELTDPLPEIDGDHFKDWPEQSVEDCREILRDRSGSACVLDVWRMKLAALPYSEAIAQIAEMYELLRHNPHLRNVAQALRFIQQADAWLGAFISMLDTLRKQESEEIQSQVRAVLDQ